MAVQVEPPLVLTCHCTPGTGVPLAAAESDNCWPASTELLAAGLVVIAGATPPASMAMIRPP